MLSALPVAATVLLTAAAAPGPSREIGNVAAFARLYGVVRFFYPSDVAADLDWNRFAVHGVSRVRAARSAAELEATLEQLVAPLGPGIEIGTPLSPAPAPRGTGEPLVAWRYLGPGFSTAGGAYRAKRTHRSAPGPTDGFATLMQTVPAEALRGKADPPAGTGASHDRRRHGRRGPVASRGPGEPGHGVLRQHGQPAGPRRRVALLRHRGHGRRRRRGGRVRRDGGRRRDRGLRRSRAGGQGRDRRLDAGPGQGPGLRGGGRRRARALVPYGHEQGRGVTAGSRRAPGRPVPPLHASAGGSRRRGALPGRRSDPGGARGPRPGGRPPGPGAARPDGRPGPPGPGPPGRARRAAPGARGGGRSERDARRRPEAGRRGRRVERVPPLLSVLDRSGRRLGQDASCRGSRPRGRPRPARPSATRSRGWSPTCATATGSWRTPWTRRSAGSCRWRSPSSRAGWSSRRAACRPRCRWAPSS